MDFYDENITFDQSAFFDDGAHYRIDVREREGILGSGYYSTYSMVHNQPGELIFIDDLHLYPDITTHRDIILNLESLQLEEIVYSRDKQPYSNYYKIDERAFYTYGNGPEVTLKVIPTEESPSEGLSSIVIYKYYKMN